jgi:hypothetical protein
MRSLLIGLTGGIGTGKSRVADLLRALGAAVECSDLIVRELQAPGGAALEGIRRTFGDEYLTPAGELDRAKLGLNLLHALGAGVEGRHVPLEHRDAGLGLEFLCGLVVASVIGRDFVAGGFQCLGDRSADAAAAARDQRYP